MKKLIKNVAGNKELLKAIQGISYYGVEQFVKDGLRYIKAIKERRMICNIVSVAPSGMSRCLKFIAPEMFSGRKEFAYLNFHCFFVALGYTRKDDAFRVNGCGMDMVFATNYNNIHNLERLGFITKEECAKLAQMTPSVI